MKYDCCFNQISHYNTFQHILYVAGPAGTYFLAKIVQKQLKSKILETLFSLKCHLLNIHIFLSIGVVVLWILQLFQFSEDSLHGPHYPVFMPEYVRHSCSSLNHVYILTYIHHDFCSIMQACVLSPPALAFQSCRTSNGHSSVSTGSTCLLIISECSQTGCIMKHFCFCTQ